MDSKKLIIPTEIKVCATCSYWDGDRRHDPDMRVVVVDHCVDGECLVKSQIREGLYDTRRECNCLWEDMNADPPEEASGGEAGKPADSADPA